MKSLAGCIIFLFSICALAQEKPVETGSTGYASESGGVGVGRGSGMQQFNLAGRKKEVAPTPGMSCKETGRVTVKIYVDRTGKVTKAEPGQRGTTNRAPCLLEEAKKAALLTRFDSNETAPELQVGAIHYNFRFDDPE